MTSKSDYESSQATPTLPNTSPASRLDPVHSVFLLLRVMTVLGGFLWTTGVADREEAVNLGYLLAGFVLFSVILGTVYFGTSLEIETVYRLAMPCDAAFIFAFIELAGDQGAIFLPAYSLLVGLHAYYFGFATGLSLAGACAVLLIIHSQFGTILNRPFELFVSMASLLLLGGALGWLSQRKSSQHAEMEATIEQLHQMGRALEQSEKIAILGRLTSRIAHEINNPISAVLTRLECMLQDARDEGRGDAEVEDLHVLLRLTHRLANISGKLLRFARPASEVMEEVDVNAFIERAVQSIEHRLPEKGLTLNLNLSSNLPKVLGHAGDLEEVVLNLLINAIDACPPNGQIYIISALSGGREKTLQVFVADTGGGIRSEDLEQVFEPFFTTKDVGAGTGLGLFITHEIVREHRGTIEVTTEPGKGTTFVINLPVPSSRIGGETIRPTSRTK